MSKAPSLEDYTVAWLAPLHFEVTAALFMLDEHHEAPTRKRGQTVQYHLGRIEKHNVAIAGFPDGEVGIGIAASIATEVIRDFPNLEVCLLVGIAAGIPSARHDIHLGDVAVAVPADGDSGVIGYDMVKVEPEEIKLKLWQNASSTVLRSVITNVRARSEFEGYKFLGHLACFHGTLFQKPQVSLGTSYSAQMMREPSGQPAVHYGRILSGNRVIKSAKHRDDINRKYDAIAIEMEAAGMANRLPVAVIRGISDLADEDKNDGYQFYAAANAAAFAKELLRQLQPSDREYSSWRLEIPIKTLANSFVEAHELSSPASLVPLERMSLARLNLLLDERSQQFPILDWRNSIIDLLKLLSLDHTLAARSRLARRWNVVVGRDGDAVRNIALHGVIIDELAKNQGNVPRGLEEALQID